MCVLFVYLYFTTDRRKIVCQLIKIRTPENDISVSDTEMISVQINVKSDVDLRPKN